jgi:hypothetical protein
MEVRVELALKNFDAAVDEHQETDEVSAKHLQAGVQFFHVKWPFYFLKKRNETQVFPKIDRRSAPRVSPAAIFYFINTALRVCEKFPAVIL